MRNRARGPARLYAHGIRALRHIDDFVIEQHFDIRIALEPLQDQLCGLELFALHDE